MSIYWNNLTAACVLGVMIGCGGGSSSSSDHSSSAASTAEVSGKASKGIIKNGVVKIFGVSGGARQSEALVSGMTGTDGGYTLTVSGYSGPVIVEISSLSPGEDGYPSVMVCDIPAGCGQGASLVAFGDDYNLAQGFNLGAVVPAVNSGDEVTVNVSAITNLAAVLAEENGVDEKSAKDANIKAASHFGLSGGDLLSLEVVDITDPVKLAAAPEKAQRAALISAGLLSAGIEAGAELEKGLLAISRDFSSKQGQFIFNESIASSTVTLEEIWQAAKKIVESAPLLAVDLTAVKSIIDNKSASAGEAPADELTDVTVPNEELGNSLEIAKALVQDLRDISTAATFKDIETGATRFADNLAEARDVASGDTRLALEALGMAAEAIAEAKEMAADNSSSYEASNGVWVAITRAVDGDSYAVSGDVQVSGENQPVAVVLDAGGPVIIEDNETQEMIPNVQPSEGTFLADVDFSISGSAEYGNAKISIVEGLVKAKLEGSYEDSQNQTATGDYSHSEAWDLGSSVENLELSLKVTIEQTGLDNPASFTGSLAFEATAFDLTESGNDDLTCLAMEGCTGSYENTQTLKLNKVGLTLSGTFAQGENSFGATFTVNIDGKGNEYQRVYTESMSGWSYSDNETITQETADNYINLSFALGFEAQLQGINGTTGVTLSGDRSGLNSGVVSLALTFEGKTIDADVDVETHNNGTSVELTISNHNGASLIWMDGIIEDEIPATGSITVGDNEEVATIKEENGLVIISYKDGAFESL